MPAPPPTKKEKEMILDLLKNQLWWILQITGSLGVYFALIPGRKFGLCAKSYIIYLIMAATTCSWMFLKSYQLAPSFFQAWFVGTAALTLLGFLGSAFYFKETIGFYNYVGAVIVVAGSAMLIN
jgi:hypothetical protein